MNQPQCTLNQTISDLIDGMKFINFNDQNFRSSQFMRLKVLEKHIAEKRLDVNLNWL